MTFTNTLQPLEAVSAAGLVALLGLVAMLLVRHAPRLETGQVRAGAALLLAALLGLLGYVGFRWAGGGAPAVIEVRVTPRGLRYRQGRGHPVALPWERVDGLSRYHTPEGDEWTLRAGEQSLSWDDSVVGAVRLQNLILQRARLGRRERREGFREGTWSVHWTRLDRSAPERGSRDGGKTGGVAQLEAIFFDIGGVVVHADLERYAELAAGLFDTTPEDLRREVAFRVPDLETGKTDSASFWKEVGESLWRLGRGRPAPPEETSGLWSFILHSTARVDRQVVELCRGLDLHGLVVGALSNTIEEHIPVLERLGAYDPFRLRILSCRVGTRKPEPEIYRLAAERAGTELRRCLLVDDRAANVEGARAVGMRAHHYRGLPPLLGELRRLLEL